MCSYKTSSGGCCRTSLSLVRLCDCLRFTDDPQASVSFELSRNWSRAVLWLYLIDFLQLCNFKLSSERISPKGFLASKCNVGNWIFSKLGSFWGIFLGRFFGRIFGRIFWEEFFVKLANLFESERNWYFCQDFVSKKKEEEGKKFRSLEVRCKLIALKKSYRL